MKRKKWLNGIFFWQWLNGISVSINGFFSTYQKKKEKKGFSIWLIQLCHGVNLMLVEWSYFKLLLYFRRLVNRSSENSFILQKTCKPVFWSIKEVCTPWYREWLSSNILHVAIWLGIFLVFLGNFSRHFPQKRELNKNKLNQLYECVIVFHKKK